MTGTIAGRPTWNDDHALHSRFLRGLALSPDRPAIRLGPREEQAVSYRRAHELALRWAGSLLADGTGAADGAGEGAVGGGVRRPVVGVLGGKTMPSYLGLLAGLYAGATVVPLNPAFPPVRNRRMLELSGVDALIADSDGLAALSKILGDQRNGEHPYNGRQLPVLAPGAPPQAIPRLPSIRPLTDGVGPLLREPRPVAADDAAYMLFTSGSTGTPKGVPINHGNTHHYFGLLDERYDFTPDDVFSQTFDLNFDCGMFDLFCAWGAGATVAYVPPQAYRDLPAFLAETGVTVWFSTPSAISLIRRTGRLVPGAMPTLRWSFFAGEALRCQDAADWQLATPASTLENIYGPTELTVTVTGHRWHPERSPSLAVNGLVPIGRVHQGHDHLLVTEDDTIAETEGELLITGPQMTCGYLDPADNEDRFVERDDRTWYRTGDRVRRRADGELVYLGRLDAQVQVQGWRVELAEVDHALRSCEGVEEAVTVARPVDGSAELVVFYTGQAVSPVALARTLREVLPHGMLPRHYEHVAELPLNSNCKIDRSALAAMARSWSAQAGSVGRRGTAPSSPGNPRAVPE